MGSLSTFEEIFGISYEESLDMLCYTYVLNFGNAVALKAKELGMSFEDIVKRSGVSKQTLIRLFQGATQPKLSTLQKLANAVGLELVEPNFSEFGTHAKAMNHLIELNLNRNSDE